MLCSAVIVQFCLKFLYGRVVSALAAEELRYFYRLAEPRELGKLKDFRLFKLVDAFILIS